MVGEQVKAAINFSHVVICIIDSMEAFTTQDMVSTYLLNCLDGDQKGSRRGQSLGDRSEQVGPC